MQGAEGTILLARRDWSVARLSVLFLFDIVKISRGEGDSLQPLLITAILQANQAALLQDPELQRRYGDPTSALPDDQRRPISMNALAHSLGLPFETVRRRLRVLEGQGLCVVGPAGVIVPQAAVTVGSYRSRQAARVRRLAALHGELTATGLVDEDPALAGVFEHSVRAADRLLANYMLRACEALLRLTGNVLDGMTLLALCAANIRDLSIPELAGTAGFAALARPCTVTALARELCLPVETVRRHVNRLEAAGFCRRVERGWVAALPQDAAARLAEDNLINLRRLFAQLAELAPAAESPARRQAG